MSGGSNRFGSTSSFYNDYAKQETLESIDTRLAGTINVSGVNSGGTISKGAGATDATTTRITIATDFQSANNALKVVDQNTTKNLGAANGGTNRICIASDHLTSLGLVKVADQTQAKNSGIVNSTTSRMTLNDELLNTAKTKVNVDLDSNLLTGNDVNVAVNNCAFGDGVVSTDTLRFIPANTILNAGKTAVSVETQGTIQVSNFPTVSKNTGAIDANTQRITIADDLLTNSGILKVDVDNTVGVSGSVNAVLQSGSNTQVSNFPVSVATNSGSTTGNVIRTIEATDVRIHSIYTSAEIGQTNGSSTPIDSTFTASGTTYIDSIGFTIEDDEKVPLPTQFEARAILPNGLLVIIDGTTYATLKTNADNLCFANKVEHIGKEFEFRKYSHDFRPPLKLTNNDTIIFRNQDDLSAVRHLKFFCHSHTIT